MTINNVLAAIDGGDVDDDLDLIVNAIKDRRKLLTKRMVRTVRVGQRVRFNDQTNPQYLRGVAATVTKVNQTRVAVKLDESVGRFNKEWPINTPADMLDLI